jgi:putative transposase
VESVLGTKLPNAVCLLLVVLVIEVLSRLVSQRGAPLYLRSDNGPEFVSRALLKWIVDQGIGTALIDPGKPWQNAATENLIGKFGDECLSPEWFRSRAEAKVVIESWRRPLQRGASSLEPRLPHAGRVRGEDRAARRSVAAGNGSDCYGMRSLRAPTRCITVPQGARKRSTEGGVLKLGVAKKTGRSQEAGSPTRHGPAQRHISTGGPGLSCIGSESTD